MQFKEGKLNFFSGGAKHENFVGLFDQEKLLTLFESLGCPLIIVYGEAYGGKMQGMSETYGKELKFVAFEVKIGEAWLDVENASDVAFKLRLDFVSYFKGPATIEWLNDQKNSCSVQACKMGVIEEKKREGIVIRPLKEYMDYRGNRIITKHKRDEFRETKTKREINPEKLKVIEEALEVAEEWVTPMRLNHVLGKMLEKGEMKHVPLVIKAMIEDVKIESVNEVVWSKAVEKAIGKITVKLYKRNISKI